jgi:hypothetical protein
MNTDPKSEGERWRAAMREAARRLCFPNLLFAELWIRALHNAGMYRRSPFSKDGRGD